MPEIQTPPEDPTPANPALENPASEAGAGAGERQVAQVAQADSPDPTLGMTLIADASGAAVLVDDGDRRRRRTYFLLFLLLVLTTIVALIAGWYLIFRKPLNDILPPVVVEQVPHYSFSIYDLDRPVGVAVTADGSRIYVTEAGGNRAVHVYDNRGTELAQLTRPGTQPGSRIPVYVAVDPVTADVYVSDRLARAVDIYGSDNAYKGTFQPNPPIADWEPLGLAFDRAGTLFVTDVSGTSHRILAFGRDRTLVRTITADGKLSFPNGVAVEANGDVAIADGNNGRVLIVGADDSTVGTVPKGFSTGELALPRGMAIDDSGRLYVADTSGQVVQMYRLDAKTGAPTYLATVGHESVNQDGFEYPHGLAVDNRSRIYIADWANDRLDIWSY